MKVLSSFETSNHLLGLVEIGCETQIIGELGHTNSVIIKPLCL